MWIKTSHIIQKRYEECEVGRGQKPTTRKKDDDNDDDK
jgi:hypothetical protein